MAAELEATRGLSRENLDVALERRGELVGHDARVDLEGTPDARAAARMPWTQLASRVCSQRPASVPAVEPCTNRATASSSGKRANQSGDSGSQLPW